MKDDFSVSAADMITAVFENIEASQLKNSSRILTAWRSTVESIQSPRKESLGKSIASHSKVIDLKNGILLIETDHSGWSQLLHFHQNYILTGLKRQLPDVEINSLVFRLKGEEFGLNHVDYDKQMEIEKKKLESEYQKNDEILKKFEAPKTSEEKKDVPENLKKIFDDMRNFMLTKNE